MLQAKQFSQMNELHPGSSKKRQSIVLLLYSISICLSKITVFYLSINYYCILSIYQLLLYSISIYLETIISLEWQS